MTRLTNASDHQAIDESMDDGLAFGIQPRAGCQLVQGDLDRNGKPVVRRGRKATGLAHTSQPGCRTQEVSS